MVPTGTWLVDGTALGAGDPEAEGQDRRKGAAGVV
jgi:hypothetical protein